MVEPYREFGGCKTFSVLNGKILPGAGYTTQKKQLGKGAKTKLMCPEVDVVKGFSRGLLRRSNAQIQNENMIIIRRRWR